MKIITYRYFTEKKHHKEARKFQKKNLFNGNQIQEQKNLYINCLVQEQDSFWVKTIIRWFTPLSAGIAKVNLNLKKLN